ncbi:MAG: S49 family peptidase, partial [Bacteroidales bacterium]|nr:S49 family peptidase [Bacteroidales bacterium]
MKKFLKMVLAVICGILLLDLLIIAIFSGLATPSSPALPSEGVLRIDMSKIVISEQSLEADPISMLQAGGQQIQVIGIWEATQALKIAAEDPGIKYIYLKTDGSGSDIATTEEFRKALAEYRQKSGNPVIAYMEAPTTGTYFLASVADKIYMTPHPGATFSMTGISSQLIFLGDLLKKFGVNVQLIRHGKYKSAGEMFTRSNSSPENREQNQQMVNSLWKNISATIAESRGISVEQLNDAVDNLKLCLSQDFIDCGLADALLDREALEHQLAVLAVAGKYKDVKMINFADYARTKVLPAKAGTKKIAVIYANGNIIDGSDLNNVAGDRFASIIEDVREDNNVKAVVLRVNSPGG